MQSAVLHIGRPPLILFSNVHGVLVRCHAQLASAPPQPPANWRCLLLQRPIGPPSPLPTLNLTLIYQDDDVEVWAEKTGPPTALVRSASNSTRSTAPSEAQDSGLPHHGPQRFWDLAWVRLVLLLLTIGLSWVALVAVGVWSAL